MIILSPTAFTIVVVFGFLCALGAYTINVWYKNLQKPTLQQDRLWKILFPVLFLSFLGFGVTPLLVWFFLLATY